MRPGCGCVQFPASLESPIEKLVFAGKGRRGAVVRIIKPRLSLNAPPRSNVMLIIKRCPVLKVDVVQPHLLGRVALFRKENLCTVLLTHAPMFPHVSVMPLQPLLGVTQLASNLERTVWAGMICMQGFMESHVERRLTMVGVHS